MTTIAHEANSSKMVQRTTRRRDNHRHSSYSSSSSSLVFYRRVGVAMVGLLFFGALVLDSASRIAELLEITTMSTSFWYQDGAAAANDNDDLQNHRRWSTPHMIQHLTEDDFATSTFPLSGSLRSFSSGNHHRRRRKSRDKRTTLDNTNSVMPTPNNSNDDDDKRQSQHRQPRRQCLCLSATPQTMSTIQQRIKAISQDADFFQLFPDCIHLTIHDRAMRYSTNQAFDSHTGDLWPDLMQDPRWIIHRLWYHGALTHYMGPVSLETQQQQQQQQITDEYDKDKNTIMVFVPFAQALAKKQQIQQLVHASQTIDDQAFWCMEGEHFGWGKRKQGSSFGTSPARVFDESNQTTVDVCRKGPILLRAQHFTNGFLWNYTDYGCDASEVYRWLSYQVDHQGYPMRMKRDDALPPNQRFGISSFDRTCAENWLADRPDAYRAFRQLESND